MPEGTKLSPTFRALSYFLYLYVRLVHLTSRVVRINDDVVKKCKAKSPVILTLWHEHAFASLVAHAWQKYHPIVSLSRDGEIVNLASTKLGLPCVRGSSSRGGLAARRELTDLILAGESVAFTVDGPRGPRHKTKPGCVQIAIATKVPIIPLIGFTKNTWILKKTWDKTKIPKPFSKIYLIYGPAFFCQAETFDENILQLETELMNLEAQAKQLIDEKS